MKLGWKIYWISCAVIALIGVVLCGVGFTLGASWEAAEIYAPDWISLNRYMVYTVDYDDSGFDMTSTSVEESFDQIRKIAVDADALDLRIISKESTEDMVEVSVLDGRERVSCRQSGSELLIETKEGWELSDRMVEIRLCIPEAHFEEIDIDVDAGSVQIDKFTSVGGLKLNVDAGEIIIGKFVADQVDMECGAGRIEAAGTCNKNIDIECGAGEVVYTANGKKSSYNYEVECGVGKVVIDKEVISGIGERKVLSQKAAKQMNIECGMGSVVIDFTQE